MLGGLVRSTETSFAHHATDGVVDTLAKSFDEFEHDSQSCKEINVFL